jgi:hypothetical protein
MQVDRLYIVLFIVLTFMQSCITAMISFPNLYLNGDHIFLYQ